jgi:hypothetical protein
MKPTLQISKKKRIASCFSVLIVFSVLMSSCSSGKKRLERGDYDSAVMQAVKRLRSNPDSKKASHTLVLAYDYAKNYHATEVKRLKNSADQFKNDHIVRHYEDMNRLYEEIQRCPACLDLVRDPIVYQSELDGARLAASKAHFDQGLKDMEKNDMMKAREAYQHFRLAKDFTPKYDKIDQYLREALEAGTMHVLVDQIPVHSRALQLSNEFFQNQIMESAKSFNFTFVRFYNQADINQFDIQPDEIILLKFDDFVVGQTFVKEKEEIITKDSVITGYVEKEGVKIPVYGIAKAEYRTFFKSVNSNGLLDFQIVNAVTGQTIRQQKLPGSFTWSWDWATYNGQAEALNDSQLSMAKRREAFPPPPQDLFIEFTKPIFGQIIDQIRRYYSAHN